MSRTRLLTLAVIVLLILNLGTLGFLLYNRPMNHRPRHGEGPRKIIIEKLHFDQQQQIEYKKGIRWHRGTIDALDAQILETKNRLYLQLLKTNVDNKAKDSLIDVIVGYQKQIEQTHFKHFEDIKKICRPDQLEYYDELTTELTSLFSKHPRKKHD